MGYRTYKTMVTEKKNGATPMKILLATLALLLASNLLLAQDSPLTGAQVSFDKQTTLEKIDLLKKVEVKNLQLTGTWALTGGQLTGGGTKDGGARAIIGPADLPVPEEYDISLVVTRLSGENGMAIAFPTPGGGRGDVILDYWAGKIGCGLAFVNGAYPDVSGYGVAGRLLTIREPRAITIMIRKAGIMIQVDGKDYFGKKLDWSTVTVIGSADRPDQKAFCISTWKTYVTVSQLKISYPAPEAKH